MGKLRLVNGNFYNEDYMSFDECIDLITELSYSQGFYGRLLRDIEDLDYDKLAEVKSVWEEKKFTNNIDFIMYLENGDE